MSPQHAFLAMTWQRGRMLTLVTASISGILLMSMTMLILNGKPDPLRGLVVLPPMMATFIVGMMAVFLTHGALPPKDDGLSSFLATLPFSDAELGRLMLRSWLKVMATALLCFLTSVAAAFFLHAILFGDVNFTWHYQNLWLVQQLQWQAIPVILLGACVC